MAEATRKRTENTAGDFFVDDQCISCGACWRHAPELFVSHELHTYAYVGKQPWDARSLQRMKEALAICPVQAIGIQECT